MSCNEEEIHVNDIGTVFLITVKDCVSGTETTLDVSTATTLQFILLSPSDVTKTKTAVFDTDGTDGKIKYTTINGDLDEPGTWKLQARIVMGGGDWKSDVTSFRVYANI